MINKIFLLLAPILLSACSVILPASPAPTPVIIVQQPTVPSSASPTALSNLPAASPTRVGSAPQTATPTIAVVPIPATTIQIEGVAYRSYQMPGDPFRMVCQEPCTTDPQLFFASYAGFSNVRERLLKVTGIDVLPEIQPIDIHQLSDRRCGSSSMRLNAGNHLGANYTPRANGWVCTFIFETVNTPGMIVQPVYQWINLHEYLHEIFFGRLVGGDVRFLHDIVSPVSWIVTDFDPAAKNLCTYNPQVRYGDYGGNLLYQLCRQNGFRLEHLAPSLIELDKLYNSGGGQIPDSNFKHPGVALYQYQQILNRVLGGDTVKAFADACYPPLLPFSRNATPTRLGAPRSQTQTPTAGCLGGVTATPPPK